MFAYVTVGSDNVQETAKFYDGVLGVLNAKRIMDTDSFVAWGTEPGQPMLAVIKPHNGETATAGNGTMIAIFAGSQENAQAMHAKALELGGTDEGAPGPRGDQGQFYGAYFRDPEGNKFNACLPPQ